ncbi:phaC PHA synthase [Fusobacteria bacterium ZRK30]|nr:phaC PHA synthase [Fusobacteria bacterium ZRK30]
MKRVKILLGMLFLLSSMSFATGFQFNVLDNQMPASQDVSGLRLNLLYGKTANVSGLDLPILALGEADNFTGVQFPLLFIGANKVNNSFKGVGFGLANIHGGESTGAILGAVNMTHNVKGLQWGAANISDGRTTADIGFVNISKGTTFQLGVFNMTDDLTGVQIGLINMAKTGFLPIFPFFNIDGRIF